MIKTIILGILQGLSEFLPISSSGHLVLFQKLFNMPETGLLLEILLHIGTLFAVLVIFWRDWMEMLRHLFKSRAVRLLIVATIPAVVVTLLFNDAIEAAFSGWFLGISFLITSLLLSASDWLARRARRKANDVQPLGDIADIHYRQALTMGIMQAFAIIPGVSRSGSTIVGGLASGVTKRNAARFSFMMSAIATLGSLVFKLKDFLSVSEYTFEGGPLAAVMGVIAAAISGYLAIRWMLMLIQRVSLKWFGLYTAVLGILILCDQLFFGLIFERIL